MRGRVLDNVADGANLMTDEHASYRSLQASYSVHSVNHRVGEYRARLLCHINGIEGAWSLFKGGCIHHHVSAKHVLQIQPSRRGRR